MTPRKPHTRHRVQNSQSHLSQPIQPSDYESEAPFVAPPTRSNTDLNLSVLHRYNPSITTILSIAASAVIYNFTPPEEDNAATWEKADIEGTLFVCETFPNPHTGKTGCCLIVLNKKSFENLIVDMAGVQHVEMTDEFLMVVFSDPNAFTQKCVGIYIHPDKQDTRELNCSMIKERWEAIKGDGGSQLGNRLDGAVFDDGGGQFRGRKLDINQLFGQQ